jgi:hypothetical protein
MHVVLSEPFINKKIIVLNILNVVVPYNHSLYSTYWHFWQCYVVPSMPIDGYNSNGPNWVDFTFLQKEEGAKRGPETLCS